MTDDRKEEKMENGYVSPYLRRPIRTLEQVLAERERRALTKKQ